MIFCNCDTYVYWKMIPINSLKWILWTSCWFWAATGLRSSHYNFKHNRSAGFGSIAKRGGNYHWALKLLGSNDKNASHPANVNLVFEIGSRDLLDGNYLAYFYNADVYSFEASPFNYETMAGNNNDTRVHIVQSAVTKIDGSITFLAMNTTKYDNPGAGSLYEADYVTNRNPSDPDFNISNPQIPIVVKSIRLDTFINTVTQRPPDMICLDCQESELQALQSAGELLRKVKYIIFEGASVPSYKGGNSYKDMHLYLETMGFRFLAFKKFAGKQTLTRFTLPHNFIVDNNDAADFVYINRNVNLFR